jgi:hypothetical protein
MKRRQHFRLYKLLSPGVMAILACLSLWQCKTMTKEEPVSATQINSAHLDALYAEKKVGDDTVGIIHIYAEYPDYHLVGDEDEGIACVDDASRAAIFYLRQHRMTSNPEHLHKGRMLVKFLLAMQSPNGYYYNFIWPDGRIHTEGTTTKPEPNFWSWRVLWAFGEAIDLLAGDDPLVAEMKQQRELLVDKILTEPSFNTVQTDTSMGWTFPTWLPKGSGTDQAAIVLIGLSHMLQQSTGDQTARVDSVTSFMRHFADGIMMMQVDAPGNSQDGAFLSWENLWHAYANIQSYALLFAGHTLKDSNMINHALKEVNTFYPSLLTNGRLDHFWIRMQNGKTESYDSATLPQIAYGVRPMVWASLKAYELTKENKHLLQAKDLASWFTGNNPALTPMYDPISGRGYDGISAPDQINRNAGAESTIEALLSLQALEKFK